MPAAGDKECKSLSRNDLQIGAYPGILVGAASSRSAQPVGFRGFGLVF